MDNKRAVFLLVRTALCAATLTAGKFVLSAVPNVEIVTLLCALYGYVFGWWGVLSAVIFVGMEPLLYGFGTWFVSYLLYWPLVCAVFALLKKGGVQNRFLLGFFAVLLTLYFGALTTFVDIALLVGFRDNFFSAFRVKYLAGVAFYLTEIVTNAVVFPLLFLPCARAIEKIPLRG